LHAQYGKLMTWGTNKGQVISLVGPQLLGFIWAFGVEAIAEKKDPCGPHGGGRLSGIKKRKGDGEARG
jgi:hypothetical protein